MDRRDFVRTGAVGLLGGWLGLRGEAKADVATRKEHTISERDEDWGGTPVHVIEMTLPFNEPTIFFTRDNRRILVPRQNEAEMRFRKPSPELVGSGNIDGSSIQKLLEQRIALMKPLVANLNHGHKETGHELDGSVLLLIAHCPRGTDYGVVMGAKGLTVESMLMTAPAKILFG